MLYDASRRALRPDGAELGEAMVRAEMAGAFVRYSRAYVARRPLLADICIAPSALALRTCQPCGR
jgi:hypothetical protein